MLQAVKDGEWVSSWYQQRIKEFGNDLRSLGYNQRSSQLKRFEALCELGNFDGRSLLDVGCGLGDFLTFLEKQDIRPLYTGIDITPGMIDQCKIKFRDRLSDSCQFETADTLTYTPNKKFDYVVASGIFGLYSENVEERIGPTIKRLFSWAKNGLALNFLSKRSTKPAEGRLYVEPGRLLDMALEITPAARLNHTYLPNDFTLYLYQSPSWEAKNGASGV